MLDDRGENAEVLRGMALSQNPKRSGDGELGSHARLAYLLYRWRDFTEGGGGRSQTVDGVRDSPRDKMVVQFARAFTSYGWSQNWKRSCGSTDNACECRPPGRYPRQRSLPRAR